MVFRSSPTERVAASIAIALLGILTTTFASMVPGAPSFLYGVALAIYIGAGSMATWRTHVHIQDRHRRVTRITQVFFWGWARHYPFACFRSVGIGSSRRSGADELVYRIRLNGSPSLVFPGLEISENFVRSKGAELAKTIGVPFDPRPQPTLLRARL